MRVDDWKSRLRGVFSFPVTPFKNDLSIDLDGFRANIERFCNTELAAIFVCCGTVCCSSGPSPLGERLEHLYRTPSAIRSDRL